ncbi:unnamed protein product [Ectocarpus sp. 6 AP-2014]
MPPKKTNKKKKKNGGGKTKAMKKLEKCQSSPDTRFSSLNDCVQKFGIEIKTSTLTSDRISVFGNELLSFMEICDKDPTKLFMFEDQKDIESIQHFQSLLGHKARECDAVFIWSKLIYRLVPEEKDKTLKEWELFFSKLRTTECCVCLEKIQKSSEIVTCRKCQDIRCLSCDLQQDRPECPVCREFDLEGYLRNRSIYLNQILEQAGITKNMMETRGKKACEAIVKEAFPCDSVDDLVDQAMRVCGEKVYDVRDQCKPIF